jgi:hypothetical protein
MFNKPIPSAPKHSSSATPAPIGKPPKDKQKSKGRPATKPDLSLKLRDNGKLMPEEQKRHFDKNLCMFCRLSGHLVKDCLKSSSPTLKARSAKSANSDISSETKN